MKFESYWKITRFPLLLIALNILPIWLVAGWVCDPAQFLIMRLVGWGCLLANGLSASEWIIRLWSAVSAEWRLRAGFTALRSFICYLEQNATDDQSKESVKSMLKHMDEVIAHLKERFQ